MHTNFDKMTQADHMVSLWDGIEFDEHAEILRNKREDAGIQLCSLLHQVGLSRADLARALDWKPSRVTRALSGNENLTLNTITDIIDAAGMDYDIVFRKKGTCRTFQFWEKERLDADILNMHSQLCCALGEVKDLHRRATANLETVQEMTRAVFRRAAVMKQAVAGKIQAHISVTNIAYCEEDNAPLPHAA